MSRISAAAIREAAPLLLQLVRDHEAKNVGSPRVEPASGDRVVPEAATSKAAS